MFSDDEQIEDQGFSINQKFADKYEHNQKRVELERLEAKYGKQKISDLKQDSYSESDSESEDSDAYLNTEQAESKFVELISRIKKNDKSLLNMEGNYFEDDDFVPSKKAKKDKKKTLKDVIREDAVKKIRDNESASDSEEDKMFKKTKKGETQAEEEARLKAEFKKQADGSSVASSHGVDHSDDDILIKKSKAVDDSSDEEAV